MRGRTGQATWRRAGALAWALGAALIALAVGARAASAATLSGTVTSLASSTGARPQPLAEAQVVAIDPLTRLATATATTDANGSYALFAPAGTYDVRIDGGTLRNEWRTGFVLDGDRDLDVTLVPQGSVHISGVVRDSDGTPESATFVQAVNTDGNGSSVVWVYTDAAGHFDLAPRAGPTELSTFQYATWPLERRWGFYSDVFQLAADRDFDLRAPPTTTLGVHVHGPRGESVPNARIALPSMNRTATVDGLSGHVHEDAVGATDASGDAQLTVFPGNRPVWDFQKGTVNPERAYAITEFDVPALTEGGASVDVEVAPADRYLVSGTISDENGPVQGAYFVDGGGNIVTGADGRFSFPGVEPGTRWLRGGLADGQTNFDWPMQVESDRTIALRLPARHTLTVRVVDRSGAPVADAEVLSPSLQRSTDFGGDAPGGTLWTYFPADRTDASGEVELRVFDGTASTYPGSVTFGRDDEPVSFSVPASVGDQTVTVVMPFGVDATPPTVDCEPLPSGWQSGDVRLACSASDSGSGLADPSADAAFTVATDVPAGSEDASAYTVRRAVCDVAGNCAQAGPFGPISVDAAAPRVVWELTPPPASGDWWSLSRVTVALTVSDANVSAVACAVDGTTKAFAQTRTATAITGSFSLSGEGRHTAGCTALDRLGHLGTRTWPVWIDLHAPAVPTAAADRAPDYGTAWYRDTVTVSFSDTGDPLLVDGTPGSGVDLTTLTPPHTFDTAGTFVATGSVADVAGRVSARRSLTVRVDADEPTTTISCPPQVTLGSTATASWQAADVGAGLVGAARGGEAVDTSALGPVTVTHRALDRVGHSASASCVTTVVHGFAWRGSVLEPPSVNPIAPGVATQPVSFWLGGDRGLGVVSAAEVEPIVCVGGASAGRAAPATVGPLSYVAGTRRYAFDWDVATDLPAGQCATLRLTLDDGTAHELRFGR